MDEAMGVFIRVSVAYLYILAVMRLSGKRSVGLLSPWDLLVALILADTFDDLFWGDIALSQWLVAVTTILALHVAVSYATYKSVQLDQILGSKPSAVVREGEFDQRVMAQQRMSREAILSQLRLQGVEEVAEVEAATREPDGKTSVLKREEARPVQKRDLPRLREVA